MALIEGPCRCCDKTSKFIFDGKEYIGFAAAHEAKVAKTKQDLKDGKAVIIEKDGAGMVVYRDEVAHYGDNWKQNLLEKKLEEGWKIKNECGKE